MVDEISSDKVDSVVKKHKVVIIDCYTASCQPCKILSPILAELNEDYESEGLKVVKMNMEKNLQFGMENEIIGVPVVLVYSRGERVRFKNELGQTNDRLVGLMPADDYEIIVEKLLNEHKSIVKI
jgi:thioredoxin 1